MIDPHVHCRDGTQAYKETIAHVLELAEAQGIERVFDMPNTEPPILSRQDVRRRLSLVPYGKEKMYCLYAGLTSDPEQIEEAVRCWKELPEVVGLKMFAGASVGPLAVIEDEDQKKVYETLAYLGYTGVIAVHCEREKDLRPDLWDPEAPFSHALARPKVAEINSVANQIKFAIETGFKGTLHICHISCPEAVELVVAARAQGQIRITCGVTPHHIFWTENMLVRHEGQLYKVNPPLRSSQDVQMLEGQLKDGKIDWIESDHAPHALGEKLLPPYLSGFPSLCLYKDFVEIYLPSLGLSAKQIEALTSGNISRVFDGAKRGTTTLKTRFRRDDMAKAIRAVRGVAKGTPPDIMAHLLCSTTYDPLGLMKPGASGTNRMYIMACMACGVDPDTIVRTYMPAEVAEGGECAVPARSFDTIIRVLPRTTGVELEAGLLLRRNEINLKAGNTRFKIYGVRPGEFPSISQQIRPLIQEGLPFVSVDAKILAAMIQKTVFAARKNVCSSPSLNGLNLSLTPNGENCLLTMAATDGHRIAVAKTAVEGTVTEKEATIPIQAAKILLQISKKGVVRMGFAGEWVIFDAGETAMAIKPIKEKYPRYEEVLQIAEKGAKTILTVDKERLLAALRRAKTMVRNNFPAIGISAKGGALKVSSSLADIGELSEKVPLKQDGDGVKMNISLPYLTEALRSVDGKEALITIRGTYNPVVIRPVEPGSLDEYFSVIMPIPI